MPDQSEYEGNSGKPDAVIALEAVEKAYYFIGRGGRRDWFLELQTRRESPFQKKMMDRKFIYICEIALKFDNIPEEMIPEIKFALQYFSKNMA
jgi:hypothetical protein